MTVQFCITNISEVLTEYDISRELVKLGATEVKPREGHFSQYIATINSTPGSLQGSLDFSFGPGRLKVEVFMVDSSGNGLTLHELNNLQDKEGARMLAEINAMYETHHTDMQQVTRYELDHYAREQRRRVEQLQREPETDNLENQLRILAANQEGLIERFFALNANIVTIDRRLTKPDSYIHTNPLYQGAVGALRLGLNNVLHILLDRYAPSDDNGDLLEAGGEAEFELLWSLINFIDHNMDMEQFQAYLGENEVE